MRTSRLVATAAAGVFLALAPVVETAQAREVLSDDEMAQARGGFLVADNIVFDFNAVVTTYEDGQLALQTQVTWTPTGPLTNQVAGAGVTQLTDPQLKALNGLGIPFQTASGATVVQSVDQNRIVNLLLNTASGHAFRQDTAITLSLPGFAATQAGMAQQLLGLRMAEDAAVTALRAGH